MLLRRLSQHIKNQNWFAVSLDFFIVVVGIFIGLQVTDWNNKIQRKERLNLAIQRTIQEASANIEIINAYQKDISNTIKTAEPLIKSLIECTFEDDSQIVFDTTLRNMTYDFLPSTSLIHFNRLIGKDYQDLIPENFINDLTFFSSYFDSSLLTAKENHTIYWNDHINDNPALSLKNNTTNKENNYITLKFSVSTDITTLCHNDAFIKHFWKNLMFMEANKFSQELQVNSLSKLIETLKQLTKSLS